MGFNSCHFDAWVHSRSTQPGKAGCATIHNKLFQESYEIFSLVHFTTRMEHNELFLTVFIADSIYGTLHRYLSYAAVMILGVTSIKDKYKGQSSNCVQFVLSVVL